MNAFDRALTAGRGAWGAEWTPEWIARAPGRLELLGNHVDYNGGKVLAAAIDRDVVCLRQKTRQLTIEVMLADRASAVAFIDVEQLREWRNPDSRLRPLDYVLGSIAALLARELMSDTGVRLSVAGDVPIGFGLSSSAALCVALVTALAREPLAGRDLVLIAQDAEHRAGTPCGTLDQAASVGGRVILYDGATDSWEDLSPDLGEFVFAVADSGVHRSLANSAYPTRVAESRQALALINAHLGTELPSLAALDDEQLEIIFLGENPPLPPLLERRVRHVASEVWRVAAGLDAMRAADWEEFGRLMTESGKSSANDYEISHPAVEQIVTVANEVPGVFGARMMGGGQGGTALILLRRSAVSDLRTRLDEIVYPRIGRSANDAVRVFGFADGAALSQFEA